MKNILKDEKMKSTSALHHINPGICPKCGKSFIEVFARHEKVHYCTNCRVTEPLPEGDQSVQR